MYSNRPGLFAPIFQVVVKALAWVMSSMKRCIVFQNPQDFKMKHGQCIYFCGIAVLALLGLAASQEPVGNTS